MIYKYSLSVSGDCFYPENILGNVSGEFVVNSYFNPVDKKPVNANEEYGYGSISFWHPRSYSTENQITKYEEDFIDFIEKNRFCFVNNGANELEIFIEIYFEGDQCNFEIFDRKKLQRLSLLGVSLPISIYILPKDEIEEWESEIGLKWKH